MASIFRREKRGVLARLGGTPSFCATAAASSSSILLVAASISFMSASRSTRAASSARSASATWRWASSADSAAVTPAAVTPAHGAHPGGWRARRRRARRRTGAAALRAPASAARRNRALRHLVACRRRTDRVREDGAPPLPAPEPRRRILQSLCTHCTAPSIARSPGPGSRPSRCGPAPRSARWPRAPPCEPCISSAFKASRRRYCSTSARIRASAASARATACRARSAMVMSIFARGAAVGRPSRSPGGLSSAAAISFLASSAFCAAARAAASSSPRKPLRVRCPPGPPLRLFAYVPGAAGARSPQASSKGTRSVVGAGSEDLFGARGSAGRSPGFSRVACARAGRREPRRSPPPASSRAGRPAPRRSPRPACARADRCPVLHLRPASRPTDPLRGPARCAAAGRALGRCLRGRRSARRPAAAPGGPGGDHRLGRRSARASATARSASRGSPTPPCLVNIPASRALLHASHTHALLLFSGSARQCRRDQPSRAATWRSPPAAAGPPPHSCPAAPEKLEHPGLDHPNRAARVLERPLRQRLPPSGAGHAERRPGPRIRPPPTGQLGRRRAGERCRRDKHVPRRQIVHHPLADVRREAPEQRVVGRRDRVPARGAREPVGHGPDDGLALVQERFGVRIAEPAGGAPRRDRMRPARGPRRSPRCRCLRAGRCAPAAAPGTRAGRGRSAGRGRRRHRGRPTSGRRPGCRAARGRRRRSWRTCPWPPTACGQTGAPTTGGSSGSPAPPLPSDGAGTPARCRCRAAGSRSCG